MSQGRHTQKNNKENNNNKGKNDEKSPNKYDPLRVGEGWGYPDLSGSTTKKPLICLGVFPMFCSVDHNLYANDVPYQR